jgi:hypothetical protein
MSVLDQIRKLDEQKNQLMHTAREELIATANLAIKGLNELGFHYKLISDDAMLARTGTRRTGIREQVLAAIEASPGLTRAQVLEKLNAKGDKSAEQSVSNALSALKKAGTIKQNGSAYSAA